jgi:hypothetical protein
MPHAAETGTKCSRAMNHVQIGPATIRATLTNMRGIFVTMGNIYAEPVSAMGGKLTLRPIAFPNDQSIGALARIR